MPSAIFEVYVAQQRSLTGLGERNPAHEEERKTDFDRARFLAKGIVEHMVESAPDLAVSYALQCGDGNLQATQTPFISGALDVGIAVRSESDDTPEGEVVKGYSLMTDVAPVFGGTPDIRQGVYAKLASRARGIQYPEIGDRTAHGYGYNHAAGLEVISFLEVIKTGVDELIAGAA
jgi:hypothetical protein